MRGVQWMDIRVTVGPGRRNGCGSPIPCSFHGLVMVGDPPVLARAMGCESTCIQAFLSLLMANVGGTPNAVRLALSDWKTAVPAVRADSASRLSANETTGWKPVGHDRRDACPRVPGMGMD